MTTIYELDRNGVWTGLSRQIGEKDGCPAGWTRLNLSMVPHGKYAIVQGIDVVILDKYPEKTPSTSDYENTWELIKTERDRRTHNGGYLAAGKWFHSDTFSRSQQLGLVMMGPNIPAGLMWKTMDGSFIEMTQALANEIFISAGTQDSATFAYAESLKAQVEASSNSSSIDIYSGWPLCFLDIE